MTYAELVTNAPDLTLPILALLFIVATPLTVLYMKTKEIACRVDSE